MTEAGANIGWSVCVCPPLPMLRGLPPPFIVKEGRVTHVRYLWVVSFPPGLGENSWYSLSPSVTGHDVGCGRRPCKSSDYAQGMSMSCSASGRRGDGCWARGALRRMRWVVEGAEDTGLASVKARTVFEGHRPCPPRVLQWRKVQGVGSTVRGGVRKVRTGRCRPAPHRE